MNYAAVLKALFAVTVWGASFVATKIALQSATPTAVVWLRFTMGVLVLGAIVLLRRQLTLPSRSDLAYFAVLGFLGIAFHQWLQSTGLLTAQATTTAWIITSTPIFIALLGLVLLGERLAWYQVTGIVLATLGVLLVVTRGDLASLTAGRFGTPGDILVLISAVNWAVFSVLSRRGLKKHSATLMMFYVMGFGWLFTSLLFFADPANRGIASIPAEGWAAISFLGVLCSGVAYYFWYEALKVLSVAQTGAFLYVEPIVTVIVAALVIREAILPATLIGGAVILVGVWLVNRQPRQPAQTEVQL